MEPRSPKLRKQNDAQAEGQDFKRDRPGPTAVPVLGWWIKASLLMCPAVALVYAGTGSFANGSNFFSVLAVAIITAAASTMVGALLGFLFGLPRTLERSGSKGFLTTNTNLDQISDWLTKILVGLGLVQLAKLASTVDGLASSLVPGLGGKPGAHPFAVGLLIYAIVDGFLVSYLWTRIVASRRLKEAAEDLDIVLDPPPRLPPPLPPSPEDQGSQPQGAGQPDSGSGEAETSVR